MGKAEELEAYLAAARERALARHPDRVEKSPRCIRCSDSGWEPLGRDRLAPVKRCRNGCDIPQAEHLKRRSSSEPKRDDF